MGRIVRKSTLSGSEDRLLVVPWEIHVRRLSWHPGEHTVLIGPTGRGKSTLAKALLEYRESRNAHVLIIATKAKNSFEALTPGGVYQSKRKLRQHPRGYYLTKSWKRADLAGHERIVLWVPYKGTGSVAKQKEQSSEALQDVMTQGGWTVYIDELRWFVDRMGLKDWIVDLWTQARELGVSVIGSTQRPVWVTRDVYANSTHFYIWGTEDDDDLRRLSGIGGMDNSVVRNAVAQLQGHDVLYIDSLRKEMYVTRAPDPSK